MNEERKCAWCGVDISHCYHNAKFCSGACRDDAAHNRKMRRQGYRLKGMFGPHKPAKCAGCGAEFEQVKKQQMFCEPQGYCARRHQRNGEASKAYIARQKAEGRDKEYQAKYRSTPRYREKLKERASRPDVKEAMAAARKRHNAKPEVKAKRRHLDALPENVARRRAYDQLDSSKERARERYRKRCAEAAIATLILPISKPNQD